MQWPNGTTNRRQNNTTQNTKDWAIRIPLKQRGECDCTGMFISGCSTYDTRRVNVK